MINVLISSKMLSASYRYGATSVIVLITTNSGECRILNAYRGMPSIREKTHEPDDRARVWWCEEENSWKSVLSTFTGRSGQRPNERSLPQK